MISSFRSPVINSPDGFHRMTAENSPAFCSDVQQLCSTSYTVFSDAAAATGVSEAWGVSMSIASSSRLGVAADCAALPRPRFFGGMVLALLWVVNVFVGLATAQLGIVCAERGCRGVRSKRW